jgi:hypothetical protein
VVQVPVVKTLELAAKNRRYWWMWGVMIFWALWPWHSMLNVYNCTLKGCLEGNTYLLS